MAMGEQRATLDDLLRTEGKAELIGGRIVSYMATGYLPSVIASNIFSELKVYAKRRGIGRAFTDNPGYAVPELPSGRESFSPDTSYHTGPPPEKLMRFVNGAPTFAVEVRSENDYGKSAEREIVAKRDDYFAAGTTVGWDVDPVAECIHVYRAADPGRPTTYRRGDLAEAEPALPGWRVSVDEIFAI